MTTTGRYNLFLTVLCVLFGMGAWIMVNSVYTQMPIIVLQAPEGWSLPSYFTLLVQLANIGPIVYAIFRKRWKRYLDDSSLIAFLLVFGTVCIFALSFTYDITGYVLGQLHSIYLFGFSFFMALVGCISSLLFFPFMYTLPENYLMPYFLGEGFSGLVPSVISLIQGVQRNPRCVNATTHLQNGTAEIDTVVVYDQPIFDTRVFFIAIGCLMSLSTVSFMYLHHSDRFTHVRDGHKDDLSKTERNVKFSNMSNTLYILLLMLQLSINTMSNGIFPSIQTYSCLPYGTTAYHWAVNLSQIAGPTAAYVSFFLPVTSLRILSIGTVLLALSAIFKLWTALLSPLTLFGDAGAFVVVVVWTICSAVVSYMKLSIAAICRQKDTEALYHYGIVIQIGSALGSVLSFYLVNYSSLLHSANVNKC